MSRFYKEHNSTCPDTHDRKSNTEDSDEITDNVLTDSSVESADAPNPIYVFVHAAMPAVLFVLLINAVRFISTAAGLILPRYTENAVVRYAVIIIFAVMYKRGTLNDGNLRIHSRKLDILLAAAVGIVMQICFLFAISLFKETFENGADSQIQYGFNSDFLLSMAVSVILTPPVEEIIFRGLAYTRLRRFYTAAVSAALSAMLFAVMHGSYETAVSAFFAGLIIAFLFEKSGSILIPVTEHALFNAASYFTFFIPPCELPVKLAVFAASAATLALLIILFSKTKTKRIKEK